MIARCLCAICMDRLADTIGLVEGFTGVERARPVCWPCLSPERVTTPARYYEPVDLEQRSANGDAIARVVAAVRRIGEGTAGDVIAACGVAYPGEASDGRGPYNAIAQAIKRAHSTGAIAGEFINPAVPRQGRIYRMPRRAA